MSRRGLIAASLTQLALLAGCAHLATPGHSSTTSEQGQVTYQASAGAGTVRYGLSMGQTAIQPGLLFKTAPVYPPTLISLHLPALDIPAQLAVNGDGRVYNVIVPGEAAADPQRKAFIAAIRAAVVQWHFSPLIIQHMAADADGNSHVVDQTRPAFSQFYVFHFELKNGVPVSDTVTAAAASRH